MFRGGASSSAKDKISGPREEKVLIEREHTREEAWVELAELEEVGGEAGERAKAEDAVGVAAEEVGLLRVEVGRLNELHGEKVAEMTP